MRTSQRPSLSSISLARATEPFDAILHTPASVSASSARARQYEVSVSSACPSTPAEPVDAILHTPDDSAANTPVIASNGPTPAYVYASAVHSTTARMLAELKSPAPVQTANIALSLQDVAPTHVWPQTASNRRFTFDAKDIAPSSSAQSIPASRAPGL